MRFAPHTLALALLVSGTSAALAQPAAKAADAPAAKPAPAAQPAPPAYSKACPDCADRRRDPDAGSTRTFYLKYATSQVEMNEIANALRNLLPEDKTFVLPSESAIVIHAIPEDMTLAQKMLDDLDRPKKSWRLTYTVTEVDGANRIGAQHYSMDIVDGQQTTLQQNSKVPIGGGQHGEVMTSYTYQDIGVTFDATLTQEGAGARLRSSIVLDSIADQSVNPVVVRDSKLKGSYLLAPNKPLVLGAMDIPGSTRHLEIEVLMDPLP